MQLPLRQAVLVEFRQPTRTIRITHKLQGDIFKPSTARYPLRKKLSLVSLIKIAQSSPIIENLRYNRPSSKLPISKALYFHNPNITTIGQEHQVRVFLIPHTI